MITTYLSTLMMKTFENYPIFSEGEIGERNEIFNHNLFLQASKKKQRSIMLKSSESKYKSEINYPWDNYFGFDISKFLKDQVVLDLGCFTGGRSVAWFENYKLKHISGIDVKQVFIEAAKQFSAIHNISADFKIGFGEDLPYENETFDAILSFDVFEHVSNLDKTLNECYRVLKSGGKLYLVFPGYYHPTEHHLGLVSNTPCIHWFFSSKTYIKAYNNIIEERGDKAYWYRRPFLQLKPWERGNTINGTTLKKFMAIINGMSWQEVQPVRKPIGSIGRNMSRNRIISTISKLSLPLTYVPIMKEIFLHRITYILEK